MHCTLQQRQGVGKGVAWPRMKDLFKLNSEAFLFLSLFLFVSKAGKSERCQHLLGCVGTESLPRLQTAPSSLELRTILTAFPRLMRNARVKVVITVD